MNNTLVNDKVISYWCDINVLGFKMTGNGRCKVGHGGVYRGARGGFRPVGLVITLARTVTDVIGEEKLCQGRMLC
jgi:hypothetical protein